MRIRGSRVVLAGGLAFMMAAAGCAVVPLLQTDPFFQPFLEKTRYLMTDEEIDRFVHLPDADSKKQFIEDFWAMRDPDPTTPENENRIEFERRIKFANEWFGVMNQTRRTPAPPELHRDRGWKTDRGLAYMVLGPPDLIAMRDTYGSMEPVEPEDGFRLGRAYLWIYQRFRASLAFGSAPSFDPSESATTSEEIQLLKTPSRGLLLDPSELARAKEEWIYRDQPRGIGEPLRFSAAYRRGALEIEIPIKSVRFKEREDSSLSASFEVEVRAFRDNRKVDSLSHRREFILQEKEAENLRRLEIRIPYDPAEKGSYLFEVILIADDSSVFSRYRQTVRARL